MSNQLSRANQAIIDRETYLDLALQHEQEGDLDQAAFFLNLAVMADEEAMEAIEMAEQTYYEEVMCQQWEAEQMDGYQWGLVA